MGNPDNWNMSQWLQHYNDELNRYGANALRKLRKGKLDVLSKFSGNLAEIEQDYLRTGDIDDAQRYLTKSQTWATEFNRYTLEEQAIKQVLQQSGNFI